MNLPRLPLQCFAPEFLEAVANNIGRFLCFDKATSTLARPSAARLCVELDLRNNLPQFIWIGLFEGFTQEIIYEKLPDYCTECHLIGHSTAECKCRFHDEVAKPIRSQSGRTTVVQSSADLPFSASLESGLDPGLHQQQLEDPPLHSPQTHVTEEASRPDSLCPIPSTSSAQSPPVQLQASETHPVLARAVPSNQNLADLISVPPLAAEQVQSDLMAKFLISGSVSNGFHACTTDVSHQRPTPSSSDLNQAAEFPCPPGVRPNVYMNSKSSISSPLVSDGCTTDVSHQRPPSTPSDLHQAAVRTCTPGARHNVDTRSKSSSTLPESSACITDSSTISHTHISSPVGRNLSGSGDAGHIKPTDVQSRATPSSCNSSHRHTSAESSLAISSLQVSQGPPPSQLRPRSFPMDLLQDIVHPSTPGARQNVDPNFRSAHSFPAPSDIDVVPPLVTLSLLQAPEVPRPSTSPQTQGCHLSSPMDLLQIIEKPSTPGVRHIANTNSISSLTLPAPSDCAADVNIISPSHHSKSAVGGHAMEASQQCDQIAGARSHSPGVRCNAAAISTVAPCCNAADSLTPNQLAAMERLKCNIKYSGNFAIDDPSTNYFQALQENSSDDEDCSATVASYDSDDGRFVLGYQSADDRAMGIPKAKFTPSGVKVNKRHPNIPLNVRLRARKGSYPSTP